MANMEIDVENGTLTADAKTGNKQWVAKITGTHPQYNYDRDFVAYQKPKTSKRDSGTASVETGAVVEYVRYTHSAKNRKERYYVVVGDELVEIDEDDVERVLDATVVTIDDESFAPAVDEEAVEELTTIAGVGPSRAVALVDAGIESVEDVRDAADDELLAVDGIGAATVETIRADLCEDADEDDAGSDETLTTPASEPVAMSDGGEDAVEFETDRGADVTVTADDGTLFVDANGDDFAFEASAELTTARGTDVLDCGRQRDDSGTTFRAYIPVGAHKDEIEQLRDASEPEPTDEPLAYEVEEYTRTTRRGGWGEREITKQRLVKNKSWGEMTERERKASLRVDTDDVPDDAEPGDVLTLEDLLDDPRTSDEKHQDALDEAAETGEEVVISKSVTDCNDPNRECNLDHVARVATPEGEIETRRTHTY